MAELAVVVDPSFGVCSCMRFLDRCSRRSLLLEVISSRGSSSKVMVSELYHSFSLFPAFRAFTGLVMRSKGIPGGPPCVVLTRVALLVLHLLLCGRLSSGALEARKSWRAMSSFIFPLIGNCSYFR